MCKRIHQHITKTGSKFAVQLHIGGKYVVRGGIASMEAALALREELLQEQARSKRVPTGKQRVVVRVKPGIIKASGRYFAACSVDGKRQASPGVSQLSDAEDALVQLKKAQAEAKKSRYATKYPKVAQKPRSESQLAKKRASQKKYWQTSSKIASEKAERSQAWAARRIEKKKVASEKRRAYSKLDRLVQRTRDRIYRLAMKRKTTKPGKTIQMLGCTRDQFRAYLESQLRVGEVMANHTLDHIFPCASYDLANPVEFSNCFHFSNFQPLSYTENCSKQSKPPTKAMAQKVPKQRWPIGMSMDQLPDKYDGWMSELRQ